MVHVGLQASRAQPQQPHRQTRLDRLSLARSLARSLLSLLHVLKEAGGNRGFRAPASLVSGRRLDAEWAYRSWGSKLPI